MAVKDGPGLRPVAQSAKRHFLKLAEALTLTLPANFKLACCFLNCLETSFEPSNPLVGPKHYGSEGRIGPAKCQTSLSEPTRN